MILKSILIASIFFSINSYAKESITGAFDYKFGQVVHKDKKPFNYIGYKPLKPLEEFQWYEYHITPISNQVYRITASGYSPDCKPHYDLKEFFSKKYKKGMGLQSVKKNVKKVIASWNDNDGNNISLTCEKSELNKWAWNELAYTSKKLSKVYEDESNLFEKKLNNRIEKYKRFDL